MIALFAANKQPAVVVFMAEVFLNNYYITAQATKKQAMTTINHAATANHSKIQK